MTKKNDIAAFRDLARSAGLVPAEAERLFEEIINWLREHEDLNIPGFGILRVVTTPARRIERSACGACDVPEVKWLAFRRSAELTRRMKEW